MEVTYQAVAEVIANCYDIQPRVSEDQIYFDFDGTTCTVDVLIELHQAPPTEVSARTMCITMLLCDAEEEFVNLKDKDFTDILKLCYRLQKIALWSTVIPVEIDSETTCIGFVRSIDVTAMDLSLASQGSFESEFIRTLERLKFELQECSQIILMSASSQEITAADFELLLEESAGNA